ncbi:hypothetical protein LZ32DRAFT_193834 [Colletotrichum eremochloae]|nr:hypothetical protein LZ32DRAFT_193834 [Colletotrichum eremochloae]
MEYLVASRKEKVARRTSKNHHLPLLSLPTNYFTPLHLHLRLSILADHHHHPSPSFLWRIPTHPQSPPSYLHSWAHSSTLSIL